MPLLLMCTEFRWCCIWLALPNRSLFVDRIHLRPKKRKDKFLDSLKLVLPLYSLGQFFWDWIITRIRDIDKRLSSSQGEAKEIIFLGKCRSYSGKKIYISVIFIISTSCAVSTAASMEIILANTLLVKCKYRDQGEKESVFIYYDFMSLNLK